MGSKAMGAQAKGIGVAENRSTAYCVQDAKTALVSWRLKDF